MIGYLQTLLKNISKRIPLKNIQSPLKSSVDCIVEPGNNICKLKIRFKSVLQKKARLQTDGCHVINIPHIHFTISRNAKHGLT